MPIKYSQQMQKFQDYMSATEAPALPLGENLRCYDRVFDDYFTKKPVWDMLHDFSMMGSELDAFSRPIIQAIQASAKGRQALVQVARMTGRESFVSNELLKTMDDVVSIKRPTTRIETFLELERCRRTPANEMYFPIWPQVATFSLKFRTLSGHHPLDMAHEMGVMELFAATHGLGDHGPDISDLGRSKLTFPYGFHQLHQDDLKAAFDFQARLMGDAEAIRRWLSMSIAVSLDFIGLKAFGAHLGFEDPSTYINGLMGCPTEKIRNLAVTIARVAINEHGVAVLDPLNKKALEFLVQRGAITSEQAIHHPQGGDRFAILALEQGLGL